VIHDVLLAAARRNDETGRAGRTTVARRGLLLRRPAAASITGAVWVMPIDGAWTAH